PPRPRSAASSRAVRPTATCQSGRLARPRSRFHVISATPTPRGTFEPSMADDGSHRSPGTDLVPLHGGRGVPRELAVATDLALGVGARALRVAWRLGSAGRSAARIAASLPGGGLARRTAATLARPLLDDGAHARARSVEQAQALLEAVVPAVVELIDGDAIVRRVDLDAVLAAVD